MTLEEPCDFNPQTWDDVRCWDDIIPESERTMIGDIVNGASRKCSSLKKLNTSFYFCALRLNLLGLKKTQLPDPASAQYQAKIGTSELDMWCCGDYETCIERNQLE